MSTALEELEDLSPNLPDVVPVDKRRRPYERRVELLGPELDAPKERIERCCLKCSKKFVVSSRFLRLCDQCRSRATYLHTPNIEGW